MNGLEINNDVLQVGVRNFGRVECRHRAFAGTYLVPHEIRVDSVLADAELGRSSGLSALSEMAPGASLGENLATGFGFGVGLGWKGRRWRGSGLGRCSGPGSSRSSA